MEVAHQLHVRVGRVCEQRVDIGDAAPRGARPNGIQSLATLQKTVEQLLGGAQLSNRRGADRLAIVVRVRHLGHRHTMHRRTQVGLVGGAQFPQRQPPAPLPHPEAWRLDWSTGPQVHKVRQPSDEAVCDGDNKRSFLRPSCSSEQREHSTREVTDAVVVTVSQTSLRFSINF